MASLSCNQSATPREASAAYSLQHQHVPEPANVAPGRAVLLFSPSPAQRAISESFDKIPTYLFRLHGPSTVGTATARQVSSPAYDRGMVKGDLFQLAPEDAAKCLDDHLRWSKEHESRKECNLMSWSSSLLFLLQYALYRQNKQPDKIASLSQMRLLILYTRDFPQGTFIKDLKAIEAFYKHNEGLAGIENLRVRARGGTYYFGEYLSQGHLDVSGSCTQISIQQLVDKGYLYELCPMLCNSDPREWANAVVKIREAFADRNTAQATDKKGVRTAIAMAQAFFGSPWTVPVAVMLLSLRPRKPDDKTILDGFSSMFSEQELETLNLGSIKFDPESERMPEMKLFEDMVKAIRSCVQGANVEATVAVEVLADSFGELSVGP
ncbi:uncharacterized protein B0T15DRAFT_135944 [Chaetomium strumarium]|uniref:Uncharacterized protein n=1 Tax=Chaetomium strumarium TaxID=1170767 RepID=A0AAJ0M564_9PEZI|nr:hypothetical protein B0T15DRAFT_135944 [Chaetomium strumarium]